MPRIPDVIKELKIDEATFWKVYEKVMGKKLTSKVVTVSDTNLEKIKYVVDQLPKKSASKGEDSKKSDDGKFLKSWEIWFWGGFLSWLGFEKHTEAPAASDEDELQLHNIEIPNFWKEEEKEEDEVIYSAPNARVISRAEPRKDTGKRNYNDNKDFRNKQKAWWNISIEQGTYKPKEKPQKKESGLEFFADHLAATKR